MIDLEFQPALVYLPVYYKLGQLSLLQIGARLLQMKADLLQFGAGIVKSSRYSKLGQSLQIATKQCKGSGPSNNMFQL